MRVKGKAEAGVMVWCGVADQRDPSHDHDGLHGERPGWEEVVGVGHDVWFVGSLEETSLLETGQVV